MLGEALRASASGESTDIAPVKLGSQALGLLALLAVSGAVAFLTLSKQKLWQYLLESTQATSINLSILASNFFSSEVTSFSTPTSSSVDDRNTTDRGAHGSCDSREEDVTPEERSCGIFNDDVGDSLVWTGISFAISADDLSRDKAASETPACAGEIVPVLTVQPCTPPPAEPGRKTRHILKKVQFAPDVVEPTGDGREYRGRNRSARNTSNNTSSAGKLRGLKSQDEFWDYSLSSTAGTNALIKGHGAGVLAKPKLPANRMALYSGMLGHHSQMTLDW